MQEYLVIAHPSDVVVFFWLRVCASMSYPHSWPPGSAGTAGTCAGEGRPGGCTRPTYWETGSEESCGERASSAGDAAEENSIHPPRPPDCKSQTPDRCRCRAAETAETQKSCDVRPR